ncbi:sugar ABC transporter substrate-binding protein [Bacillaceae bacterium SIJ1]|uniref:ABC transporter substrate-binding protein n=1 Tax=Litoribacterium kuwaitense TaxID=1398745 RepID=UPI0013EA4965|nr:sugar ABC transporter substrate-binding protein [Litoribacterium kuwaitense]NGP45350.1 sugar ABC transporter substrate-binding protein [Litoribacterium kuwaitense]
MTTSHWLIRLGCVITLCLIISGCESSDYSNYTDDKVKHITITAWGNPAELEVYQRAIDEFNDLEEEIEVTLVPSPSSTYDQSLITRLQGGQAPDAFYISDSQVGFLVNNDTLLPLSDFMDSNESYVKESDFPDSVWGPAKKGDTIYAIPPDSNPNLIYYNKGLFKELGIPTPQEFYDNGDWTWDTFEDIAAEFKRAGKYAFVQDGGSSGIYNWVWSNGGRMFNDEGDVVIDQDAKTKEAFMFMRHLIDEEYSIFAGSLPQGQGQEALFLSKQVAMLGAGRWLTPMFLDADNLEFDYIPWPTNGDVKAKPLISIAYVGVNKNTKHPEATKKFVSFYTSVRGQEVRLADNGNAIPAVNSLEDIVEGSPPEHSEYLIEGLNKGKVLEDEARIPSLTVELTDIYELMFIQERSVEATLRDAAEMARFMKNAQEEAL